MGRDSLTHGYAENSRGSGWQVWPMPFAMPGPIRANGDMAYHVLDIMHGFLDASESGTHYKLPSSCIWPNLLPLACPHDSWISKDIWKKMGQWRYPSLAFLLLRRKPQENHGLAGKKEFLAKTKSNHRKKKGELRMTKTQVVGPQAPVQLRCEYVENPLGIDRPNPRLSWILKHSEPNQCQRAYQ